LHQLVQPDREPAASRAEAYFRSGYPYSNKGFEHALPDVDAAIKLNSGYPCEHACFWAVGQKIGQFRVVEIRLR
jgi:hypothetical protein